MSTFSVSPFRVHRSRAVQSPAAQASATWRALPRPTRQAALIHAVHHQPHPDPQVSAKAYEFALSRTGPQSWRRFSAVIIVAILMAVAANATGLTAFEFMPNQALVFSAMTGTAALVVGAYTIWADRRQAAELAEANSSGNQ